MNWRVGLKKLSKKKEEGQKDENHEKEVQD